VYNDINVTVLQAVTRLIVFKAKYNFSNQCYNDIVKLIIDIIPMKDNMLKDLYQSKKIVSGLVMNYEKIDACEKIYVVLKGAQGRHRIYALHRSRYVKVINEDGASITTKVAVKQLRYIPITPRLKRLFLCEETAQQMRWHKEGIHGSKDTDIMLHPTDDEAWHAPDHLIQNLHGTLGVPILVY
jgi:hypothetical protein